MIVSKLLKNLICWKGVFVIFYKKAPNRLGIMREDGNLRLDLKRRFGISLIGVFVSPITGTISPGIDFNILVTFQ